MFVVVLIKVNESYFFSFRDKNYHSFFNEININISVLLFKSVLLFLQIIFLIRFDRRMIKLS